MQATTRIELLNYVIHHWDEHTVFTPQELSATGLSKQLINNNLSRLCDDVILEKRGRGEYVLLNRARAVEYIIKNTSHSKAATDSEIRGIHFANAELTQTIIETTNKLVALRMLKLPGYEDAARNLATMLEEDIDVIKRTIIRIMRASMSQKEAVDVLLHSGGGALTTGARLQRYTGMEPEVFAKVLRDLEDSIALTT